MIPGMLHTSAHPKSALARKLGTEDVVDYDDDNDDDNEDNNDDDIDDPRYATYVSASEKCACYETGERRCLKKVVKHGFSFSDIHRCQNGEKLI